MINNKFIQIQNISHAEIIEKLRAIPELMQAIQGPQASSSAVESIVEPIGITESAVVAEPNPTAVTNNDYNSQITESAVVAEPNPTTVTNNDHNSQIGNEGTKISFSNVNEQIFKSFNQQERQLIASSSSIHELDFPLRVKLNDLSVSFLLNLRR